VVKVSKGEKRVTNFPNPRECSLFGRKKAQKGPIRGEPKIQPILPNSPKIPPQSL